MITKWVLCRNISPGDNEVKDRGARNEVVCSTGGATLFPVALQALCDEDGAGASGGACEDGASMSTWLAPELEPVPAANSERQTDDKMWKLTKLQIIVSELNLLEGTCHQKHVNMYQLSSKKINCVVYLLLMTPNQVP